MSLINDVLRDLERRKPETRETSQPMPSAAPRKPGRARWSIWLLIAASTGALLNWTLNSDHQSLNQTDQLRVASAASSPTRAQQSGETAAATPVRRREPSTRLAASSDEASTRGGSVQPLETADLSKAVRADDTDPPRVASNPPPPDPVMRQAPATPSSPRPGADPANTPGAASEQSQPDSVISIRRANADDFGQDLLADARRALAQGRLELAESRLRHLANEQPGSAETYELLATLLLQHSRGKAAIQLLETAVSDVDEPARLALLLGRLLIEANQPERARSILLDQVPASSGNPDYHLLLAAAHRLSGDHESAANLYRQLAQSGQTGGKAWIGLGVSLESLDRPAQALEAYRQALDSTDPQTAHFARERIKTLAQPSGEQQ